MSSSLLVLVVVENPGVRSSIKTVLKAAGHRLIECDSCMQAQLLMSNGVAPDLLLLSCSPADPLRTIRYSSLIKSIEADRICLIAGQDDVLYEGARACGIKHILPHAVTRRNLESQKQHRPVAGSDADSNSAGVSAEDSSLSQDIPEDMPIPSYLGELDRGNFFLPALPGMQVIRNAQGASRSNCSKDAQNFGISCGAPSYKVHRHRLTPRTLRIEMRHSLEGVHVDAMLTG